MSCFVSKGRQELRKSAKNNFSAPLLRLLWQIKCLSEDARFLKKLVLTWFSKVSDIYFGKVNIFCEGNVLIKLKAEP